MRDPRRLPGVPRSPPRPISGAGGYEITAAKRPLAACGKLSSKGWSQPLQGAHKMPFIKSVPFIRRFRRLIEVSRH
jgi:hypothetical protein